MPDETGATETAHAFAGGDVSKANPVTGGPSGRAAPNAGGDGGAGDAPPDAAAGGGAGANGSPGTGGDPASGTNGAGKGAEGAEGAGAKDGAKGAAGKDGVQGFAGSRAKAPEAYEAFTLPEGMEKLHDDVLAKFTARARADGLDQAAAQARLEAAIELNDVAAEDMSAQWAEGVKAWEARSVQMGLFSDTKLMEQATAGLEAIDPQRELTPLLADLGLDKHPALIRVFAEYGKSLVQANGLQNPSTFAGSTQRERTPYEKIWGVDPRMG